jgi:cyclophilin family peptidyl-prolyl cis-trans isomerase
VGTPKRERQKANRALRHVQQQQDARKSAVKRNAIKWGAAIAAAFAAVLLIAWIGGAFDSDDDGTLTQASAPAVSAPAVSVAPITTAAAQGTAPITTAAAQGTAPATAPAAECPPTDGSAEQQLEFTAPQPMCIDTANTYTAEIVTNKGTLTVELLDDQAPLTVNNFVTLARYHYFDGIGCHRIIPGFMAQCGDPSGTGSGGPGYSFQDELPTEPAPYKKGALAMANSGPNTQGSQFFIMTADSGLAPQYSLFGQVTEGLDDTVDALDAAGNPDPAANGVPPLEEVTIESVTITES